MTRTHMFLSFRISVDSRAVLGKHHAWCKLTSRARRSLTPRDFPYGAEKLIKEQTGITAILLPATLRSNWLGDITHCGVLAITVQHHDDWEPLQKQNLLHITERTGKDKIIRSEAARGRARTTTSMSAFPLNIINLRKGQPQRPFVYTSRTTISQSRTPLRR